MYANTHANVRVRRVARWGVSTAVVATFAASGTATAAPGSGGYPGEEPFSRPCFMVQSTWNTALDGPQPLCPGRAAGH